MRGGHHTCRQVIGGRARASPALIPHPRTHCRSSPRPKHMMQVERLARRPLAWFLVNPVPLQQEHLDSYV